MLYIERISVKQAREKANQALLVCAYDNEAKYRIVNLEGSISLATSSLGWLRYRRRRKSFSIERDPRKRALPVWQPNIRRKALPTLKYSRAASQHGKLPVTRWWRKKAVRYTTRTIPHSPNRAPIPHPPSKSTSPNSPPYTISVVFPETSQIPEQYPP